MADKSKETSTGFVLSCKCLGVGNKANTKLFVITLTLSPEVEKTVANKILLLRYMHENGAEFARVTGAIRASVIPRFEVETTGTFYALATVNDTAYFDTIGCFF